MAAGVARPAMQSCRTSLRCKDTLFDMLASWHLSGATAKPHGLHTSSRTRPQAPPSSQLPVQPCRRCLSTTRSLASQQQQTSRFSYNVAASYIAKDRPYDPSTHVFHFNPYNRVQPPKKRSKRLRPESGQDAFFVTRMEATGGVALGVADGVGGWMDSGVDPADFSHGFCDYMAAAAHEHRAPAPTPATTEPRSLTARNLMQIGYDAVCADPAVPAGGSTAVVALLDPSAGALEVANLGDSGFVHLRLGAVHAASQPQTHAFNTPFQLSVVPKSIMLRMAAFGGAQLSDLPRDAEVSRHALRHGDVLVFASDGVWDNLFNQDILRIVAGAMRRAGAWVDGEAGVAAAPDLGPMCQTKEVGEEETTAGGGGGAARETRSQAQKQKQKLDTLQSAIATEITAAAKAASVNTKLDGPFAKEVKKYYPQETWHGGKVDDICVVAVVVAEFQVDQSVKSKL